MHPTYPTTCAYVEQKKWTSVSPCPVAHLLLFITVAALLVQALGFALWCTIAVYLMYMRCVNAEEKTRAAENRAAGQGLTRVHSLGEPFLTQVTPYIPPSTP